MITGSHSLAGFGRLLELGNLVLVDIRNRFHVRQLHSRQIQVVRPKGLYVAEPHESQ